MKTPTRMKTLATVCVLSIASAASVLLGAAPQTRATGGASSAGSPHLLVLIVVDQFTADYIDMYAPKWTKGLHRLLSDGAVFTHAAYPYANTVTCPGHNTIGTGVLPNVHGMIANAWYERASGKSVACTEDASVASVAFGGLKGAEHHGPKYLLAPSFADRLREQSHGAAHIVSMSLKARSAIGMAGHAGANTTVVWLEDNGIFATSSAYAKEPPADVEAYIKAHPIARDYDQVWTRSLPESSYQFDDDGLGEAPTPGWLRTFPHALAAKGDDKAAVARATALNWQHSPWSDAYLGDMAASVARSMSLGQGAATDMLAVSFSALDMVGHPYGPRSHEVQDVLARLDATIGTLLDDLDRQVGRDHYVVAWSADHGIGLIPEQAARLGFDAGRVPAAALRDAVEQTGRAFTAGPIVANITWPHVYLTPKAAEALRANPAAKRVIASAIRGVPGVQAAYWADELAAAAPTRDKTLAQLRLSYVADRAGDLMLVPRLHWISAATGATHGSQHPYDQHVPLVLMGAGIKRGTYAGAAGPMDIAPTFARIAGVAPARTDGRVLTEALITRH